MMKIGILQEKTHGETIPLLRAFPFGGVSEKCSARFISASIAQLAARGSHNPEVVSSNLTRGTCFPISNKLRIFKTDTTKLSFTTSRIVVEVIMSWPHAATISLFHRPWPDPLNLGTAMIPMNRESLACDYVPAI